MKDNAFRAVIIATSSGPTIRQDLYDIHVSKSVGEVKTTYWVTVTYCSCGDEEHNFYCFIYFLLSAQFLYRSCFWMDPPGYKQLSAVRTT